MASAPGCSPPPLAPTGTAPCPQKYPGLEVFLSLRDLVIMMADRGISVTHTTILRWVQRYLPEFEKRWRRYARPVGGSWRMRGAIEARADGRAGCYSIITLVPKITLTHGSAAGIR